MNIKKNASATQSVTVSPSPEVIIAIGSFLLQEFQESAGPWGALSAVTPQERSKRVPQQENSELPSRKARQKSTDTWFDEK